VNDLPVSIAQIGALRDSAALEDAQRRAAHGSEHAAEKFEALLATQMFKQMRTGLDEGFFGNGPGAEIFEGWLDENLGSALSKSGALDLASAIRISLGEKQTASEAAQKGNP
jgi:Rod binding domain-containing protein